MDAQAYFAEILWMKSLLLLPKISNSHINQFSKDCSEKGIGNNVGLSTQLHKVFNFEWCWQPQAGKKACVQDTFLKGCQKYMYMIMTG